MADTSVTLALEGDISLSDFATAMHRLDDLLRRLATSLTPKDGVTYTIAALERSSAVSTVEVGARSPEAPPRLVTAYHTIGQALAERRPIPFTPGIRRAAIALGDVAERPSVRYLRFQTHLGDVAITSPDKEPAKKLPVAYGTVYGTVQTLTNRRGLRFTLYDTLFDRPVACYLSEQDEEKLRNIWGRPVVVMGQVTRDPDSWQPLAVRSITSIDPVDQVDPESYRRARGVLPFGPGDEPAEKLIRSIRDVE